MGLLVLMLVEQGEGEMAVRIPWSCISIRNLIAGSNIRNRGMGDSMNRGSLMEDVVVIGAMVSTTRGVMTVMGMMMGMVGHNPPAASYSPERYRGGGRE